MADQENDDPMDVDEVKIVDEINISGIPLSSVSVRGQLGKCLENLKSQGTFAISESLKIVPNAGLVVRNVGIGLPLSSYDARTISHASNETFSGEDLERGPDIDGMNFSAIGAVLSRNDFHLANPEWAKYINKLTKHIGKTMGIGNSKQFEAQLDKVFLVEENAM